MSEIEKVSAEEEPVFVLPEDFDESPVSDKELDWLEAHGLEIAKDYAEQWIAIKDDAIVAHGADLVEVGKQLDRQGIESPFVIWIPPYDENPPPLMF